MKRTKARSLCAAYLLACSLLIGGCASSRQGNTAHESSDGVEISSASTESQQNESAEDGGRAQEEDGVKAIATDKVMATLNGKEFTIELANNETASAFAKLLPLDTEMSELNGNEKFVYLDENLPSNPSNPEAIEAGDVMLYGNNCLVVFYVAHPNTYTYTRIGKIADTSGLVETLGKGSITASFAAE